jgi:hypothetical protein
MSGKKIIINALRNNTSAQRYFQLRSSTFTSSVTAENHDNFVVNGSDNGVTQTIGTELGGSNTSSELDITTSNDKRENVSSEVSQPKVVKKWAPAPSSTKKKEKYERPAKGISGEERMQIEEALIQRMKKEFAGARNNRNPKLILNCFMKNSNQLSLGVEDLMGVLWACNNVSDERNEQAYKVYSMLKATKTHPVHMFPLVLSVCAARGDGEKAVEIARDLRLLNYGDFSEEVFGYLFQAICNSVRLNQGGPNRNSFEKRKADASSRADLDYYYKIFLELTKKNGWKNGGQVFSEVANAYINLRSDKVMVRVRVRGSGLGLGMGEG